MSRTIVIDRNVKPGSAMKRLSDQEKIKGVKPAKFCRSCHGTGTLKWSPLDTLCHCVKNQVDKIVGTQSKQ